MKKTIASENDLKLLFKYGLSCNDVNNAVLLKFKRGEFFLREGEQINYLYFVVSGKAKVCINVSNGKQLLLAFFISEGIIGDMELMSGEKQACSTLQAVSDFICIGLPMVSCAELLKKNIDFVNHVGQQLAYKLKQQSHYCAITVLHPLEEKLCTYILQTSIQGIFCETLTDVAGFLGTSYRHLLRCLDKLCRDGVLKKSKKGFVILNQEALNQLATDLYIL
ncbi:MAG: cyclic nucleotide-binding domain-containing protein [Lachnospiraceae bacterium]